MYLIKWLIIVLISLLSQTGLIIFFDRRSIFQKIYDLSPSSHKDKVKTPSFGGLGIILTAIIGTLLLCPLTKLSIWWLCIIILFGFIGFDKNDEPTEIVREMLKTSDLRFIRIKKEIVDFKVFYPSAEELFQATPLPWASGRSWLKGIESGMSGLGRYLNIESGASRSEGGIQSKDAVRSGGFKNTKYISEILNNFIKKINKLSIL